MPNTTSRRERGSAPAGDAARPPRIPHGDAFTLETRLRRGSGMLLDMERKGSHRSTEYGRLLQHFLTLLDAYEDACAREGYRFPPSR